MKLIFSIFFLMISLYACNNSSVNDTPIGDSANKTGKDSNVSAVHTRLSDTAKNDGNQELADMYNEYVARYTKPCIIDSGFIFGIDTFQLRLKHYCLMDSAIKVPKQYVYMYKLDSFVTHNFVTTVRLDKNSKTILQRTVYKKDFEKLLYQQLKEYGTLRCPSMKLVNDSIELDYSISIPLTDVGIGITMVINRDGAIAYKNH